VKPEDCLKLDECYKIKMVLDKDLLDFQYAEAIREVCANCSEGQRRGNKAKLETRVFELSSRKYTNLTELAKVIGMSVSQIYRVKNGIRPINEKFIIGGLKAFPGYKLEDLFYVAEGGSQND